MPSKIKLLSQDIINKIAAGEVVERPASVVKELVENSIDAGAMNITVEIENGGLNLVKITDDGSGMNREDAEMSVRQHATSKLVTEDDLFNINTLGFRGEALASIASVSQFRLVTAERDSDYGTQVSVDNNGIDIQNIGAAPGTSIEIKNLFYNIPARQKYLKTVVTEFNHIVDLFLTYCLIYPAINWKLLHNHKVVYQFYKTDWQTRISDVLGDEIGRNIFPIETNLNGISVTGFLGKPQIARNNHKLQYLFINNRPVNDFIIAKNVKDSYLTSIPRDLFPVYIFNLKINNEKVDVNVHPRKLEVRFSEPYLVYKTIYESVSRTLDENDLGNKFMSQESTPVAEPNWALRQVPPEKPVFRGQFSFGNQRDSYAPSRSVDNITSVRHFSDLMMTGERTAQPAATLAQSNFRILAQIQNSYIIVETDDGIKIYDQHATSERLQYEKIKRQWEIGQLASQKLLIPQNIELAPREKQLYFESADFFNRLGFEIADLGQNTVSVSAVPQFLVEKNIDETLKEMLGELFEKSGSDEVRVESLEKVFNIMACRSAIKFGDPLSVEGMIALINDLSVLPSSKYTCVHGRPCFIEFPFEELEKLFKRRN